jgi:hypothetical protein
MTEDLLMLLALGRHFQPQLPEAYQLTAEILERSIRSPSSEHFAALAEGARLFPSDSELLYAIGEAHAKHRGSK